MLLESMKDKLLRSSMYRIIVISFKFSFISVLFLFFQSIPGLQFSSSPLTTLNNLESTIVKISTNFHVPNAN